MCVNNYAQIIMNRADRVKEFAKIFTKSRATAGVSQDYIAAELGVTRKTIQNWESGSSSPNAFQLTEWFRALNLNPTPYLFEFFNSEIRQDDSLSKEEKLEQSFEQSMSSLSVEQKRKLLYIITGTYQGDPNAIIELCIAHAHLPMQFRFSLANQVYETYKLCEQAGLLRDDDYIMPNVSILENAIDAGRIAAIEGKHGYHYKESGNKKG